VGNETFFVKSLEKSAETSPNKLGRLIKLFDRAVDGAGVVGSAAATGADDVRAGGEDIWNGARSFFRRLFVNGF